MLPKLFISRIAVTYTLTIFLYSHVYIYFLFLDFPLFMQFSWQLPENELATTAFEW